MFYLDYLDEIFILKAKAKQAANITDDAIRLCRRGTHRASVGNPNLL